MFQVGELGAVITTNQKPFNRAMRDIHREGDKTSKAIENLFVTAGAAIGASFLAAGAMAVKRAADVESLRIQIDTLVGSAKEGERVFKRLEDFSAGTPFQLNDLVKANNILIGMGQSADEAFTDLDMLGDVASATGANINELAVTFGQASAEGKLMTRDIREFINRGVPLTKLLTDSMGVAKDEIFDLASESKITFDVLQKALQDATTGTGIYAGATEKAADSAKGSFSTLTDNANIFLASMGDLITESTDLNAIMQDASGEMKKLTTSMEDANVPASDLAAEFRGMYIVLKEIPRLFREAKEESFGFIKGIQAVQTGGITFFTEKFSTEFREMIRDIGQADRFFKEAGKGLQMMLNADTSNLTDIDADLGGIVDKAKNASSAFTTFRPAIENIPPVAEIFDPSVLEQFNMTLDEIMSNIDRMGDFSYRLFAPGSIGSMREEIAKLEEQLIHTTDPSKARELQTEIDILNASIQNMRHGTEELKMSLNDIVGGFGKIGEEAHEASAAARFFSHTLADGLENVLFQARSVEDAIKGILRQLASRALVTGLMSLFPAGFGTTGFLGAMFGGGRAMGGPVNTGKAYLVGEQGPELFMPGTSGSIVPNGGGGGKTLNLNISLDGKFTQSGTDLEAAIRETVRQQARLG